MPPEKTISSRSAYKGDILKVRIDTIRTADGREKSRTIVEHPEAIVVVAVDDRDNVLLVEQFRKPIEKDLLEIPAGSIDPGEDAETATIREMQEETGYLPRKLVKLGGFYSAPGYCTEYLHLYLATGLKPSRLVAEDTDEIKVVKIPVVEIPALLSSGKITDAKTIAGLYMFLDYQKRNQG
ncbi:MAG: NUDIX hydrolase [Dehalococcoidales bacterium]|nr:NUDIX hydrolase [Dehalococcoidales bacterium]